MAEAYLLITEGTGAKMDMRTVGTVPDRHRQVLVVGDPVTDTAVAPVTAAFGLGVDLKRAPADPFGANADAAVGDAAGSINAHARAIAASASVLDDWDESDRAKVNPIAGQAGVAAGAGAVGATVQRTTLASDDPAVAVLGATADAAVTTNAVGTISAKLRGIIQWLITISGNASNLDANLGTATDASTTIGSIHSKTRYMADVAGTTADAAAGDATGSINAHLRALHTVLGTGTEAAVVGGTGPIAAHARAMAIALGTNADATVTAGAAGSIDAILRSISRDIIANIVLGGGGPVAHAVAISGNPYRLAGRALTADYTALTTGQTADLITTLGGKLITHPYSLPENLVKGLTADMTGTTSTSLIAAPSAGLRNYVTQLTIENSHATVGTWVNVQDGSGGTAFYTVYCAPGGGGVAITFPAPLRQPTTATAIYVANVTTGANVRASASGFVAP